MLFSCPHPKVSNNHLPMDYSRVQVWTLTIELCFLKLGFHWYFLFSLKLSQVGRGQLMQDFVHYTQSYPSNSKRPGRFKTILIPFKSAPITSFLLLGQWLVCFSLSNRCWIWHLLCQVTSHVQLRFLLKKHFTWKKTTAKKTSNGAFFQIWRYHLASCGIGSGMCHQQNWGQVIVLDSTLMYYIFLLSGYKNKDIQCRDPMKKIVGLGLSKFHSLQSL